MKILNSYNNKMKKNKMIQNYFINRVNNNNWQLIKLWKFWNKKNRNYNN